MVVIQDRVLEHDGMRVVVGATDDRLEGAEFATTWATTAVERSAHRAGTSAASDRFAEMQDVGDCEPHVSVVEVVEPVARFGSCGRYNLVPRPRISSKATWGFV